MQRIIKCDKCKKDFIQKWINRKKQWSQLNQIDYWTNGKKWNSYKLFCRTCLNNWFELEREKFNELVDSKAKRKIFFSYRGHGAFNKPDYPERRTTLDQKRIQYRQKIAHNPPPFDPKTGQEWKECQGCYCQILADSNEKINRYSKTAITLRTS